MDRDPVRQSASRSVGFSKWTVLIGRTGFDAISSIPDPTLSLRSVMLLDEACRGEFQLLGQGASSFGE